MNLPSNDFQPATPEPAAAPASALVVGAGIGGLTSALALARAGVATTLLERDTPPPDSTQGDAAERAFYDWPRRGAAQFRHPHAFLGLMCNLLQDRYPDLLEAFFAAGARRFDFADALPTTLRGRYRAAPEDERLWMLLCRRATIETVLREYVTREPNVELRNQTRVEGLIAEPGADGTLVAKGVHLNGKRRAEADVVVDASGRNSKFPRWLEALGARVTEERADAEIVYYTRHYQLLPGQQEPPRDPDKPGAGDLGYMKYGVFPGDHGNFALILCLPLAETELREAIRSGAGFDAVCRTIPGLVPWIRADMARATTEPFGIGHIHAVWRHFMQDGVPTVLNYFAVADAAVRTNPLYGRGCSTATLHAHLLADLLVSESDPLQRALKFQQQTEAQLRPIFQASLEEDRRGLRRAAAVRAGTEIEAPRNLKAWFALAFGDALAAAARENLHVIRGMHRTINLLERPGAFLEEPVVKRTVLRYMLRGRKRNAKARYQPGLARAELLQRLGLAQRKPNGTA